MLFQVSVGILLQKIKYNDHRKQKLFIMDIEILFVEEWGGEALHYSNASFYYYYYLYS